MLVKKTKQEASWEQMRRSNEAVISSHLSSSFLYRWANRFELNSIQIPNRKDIDKPNGMHARIKTYQNNAADKMTIKITIQVTILTHQLSGANRIETNYTMEVKRLKTVSIQSATLTIAVNWNELSWKEKVLKFGFWRDWKVHGVRVSVT